MDWSKILDSDHLKLNIPEIRFLPREDYCPAAPVCEAVGNLDESCRAGGPFNLNSKICMASLILLLSRAFGIWPQEMIDEIERRRIGFDLSEE